MKKVVCRRLWLVVCVLAMTQLGCGAPIIPIAIWVGKVILYTAAVRATIQLVDQVIGQQQSKVSSAVVPNSGDSNRGVLPTLTVGKKNNDGTPTAGGSVTFQNVPVIRSSNGQWIVEKYYHDTVIEPKLKDLK
jgi:hypothetical protein